MILISTNYPITIMIASKSELISWINSTFDLNYTKVDQCGNGVVYCLIFNSLYPNIINPAKINTNPKTDFQILNNFKLLQFGFNKVNINRNINVDKLIKCRLQDNLEFLQWFSRLWDEKNNSRPISKSSNVLSSRPSPRPSIITHHNPHPISRQSSTIKPQLSKESPKPSPKLSTNITPITKTTTTKHTPIDKSNEISTLLSKIENLEKFKDGLEIERNFYFDKLRDIEILCQNLLQSKNSINLSTNDLINDILEIMYATEDGFLPPESDDIEQDQENNQEYDHNHDHDTNQDTEITTTLSNSPKSITSPIPINNSFNNSINNDFLDDETF